MKIIAAEVLKIAIPFRLTFKHSLASRKSVESILVRVCDDSGSVGYGECVPRAYVTGETPNTVLEALSTTMVGPYLGTEFSSFEEVTVALKKGLQGLPRHRHAASCALELALLDLAGKVFGLSAGAVAGPVVHPEIYYSAIVSADAVEAALKTCEEIRDFGFRSVKVKVGRDPASDLEILKGAREILGENCSLRIDANCAWNGDQALRQLEVFEPIGLDGVEQPLLQEDLAGLVWLTERSPVPVIVDESLVSVEDAKRLAERKACHYFNIRISKCGGLLNAAKIRDIGEEMGIGCMLGAQVGETALLSAAGRHFGTRTQNALFLEGSYGTLLLERDIGVDDLTVHFGGRGPALEKRGLGVDVDENILADFVEQSVLLGDESCRSFP